jgi:hypothetical protein
MTKSEILVIVQRMKNDWQAAIDGKPLEIETCYNGFCYWFMAGDFPLYTAEMNEFYVIQELQKDYLTIYPDRETYWYPTYNNQGSSALKPRLDHLNRTIARLENEIKTSL